METKSGHNKQLNDPPSSVNLCWEGNLSYYSLISARWESNQAMGENALLNSFCKE